MRWIERLIGATCALFFGLAGLMALPSAGPTTFVTEPVYAALGQEYVVTAADPYRPVEGTLEEIDALGKRYLAAVEPGNTAAMAFLDAAGRGSWPAMKSACGKAVVGKKKTLALLTNGSPEWPRDLRADMKLLTTDVQNDIDESAACASAKTLEDYVTKAPVTTDSGAADRIRVRLGLAPRPAV